MSCKVIGADTVSGIRFVSWQQAGHPDATEAGILRQKMDELNAAVDARIRDASERAFQQGTLATNRALEEEARATLDRLGASMADVANARKEAAERAEADILRLAVEIARRVIFREISVDPAALGGLVKAALDKLKYQEIIRVRVHPAHADVVRDCIEKNGKGQSVEVIADPLQPKGGIVFDVSRGSLDASVEAQLKEIERGLVDQLRSCA